MNSHTATQPCHLHTTRRVDQTHAQRQQQAGAQSQYQAQLAQKQARFGRAAAACMQGRGYSVN